MEDSVNFPLKTFILRKTFKTACYLHKSETYKGDL
jgi:hypothetical protein